MKGVAAWLRLVYAPDEAASFDSLAAAAADGCLHEVARWAHKLDAPRLLGHIATFMEGEDTHLSGALFCWPCLPVMS